MRTREPGRAARTLGWSIAATALLACSGLSGVDGLSSGSGGAGAAGENAIATGPGGRAGSGGGGEGGQQGGRGGTSGGAAGGVGGAAAGGAGAAGSSGQGGTSPSGASGSGGAAAVGGAAGGDPGGQGGQAGAPLVPGLVERIGTRTNDATSHLQVSGTSLLWVGAPSQGGGGRRMYRATLPGGTVAVLGDDVLGPVRSMGVEPSGDAVVFTTNAAAAQQKLTRLSFAGEAKVLETTTADVELTAPSIDHHCWTEQMPTTTSVVCRPREAGPEGPNEAAGSGNGKIVAIAATNKRLYYVRDSALYSWGRVGTLSPKLVSKGYVTVKAEGPTAWASGENGELMRLDDDADAPVVLPPIDESVQGNVTHFGVTPDHVYLATAPAGGTKARIWRASAAGVPAELVADTACAGGPDGVAAAAPYAYFFCADDDGIYRVAAP